MGKLLIAVRSDILADSIARAIPSGWDIGICCDGKAALDALLTQKPDALVLDLRLPYKSGLAVLEECFPMLPPAVLLLTDLPSEYLSKSIHSFGISFAIQLPSPGRTIAERIVDIASAIQTPPTILTRHLNKLGLCPSHDGYSYLHPIIEAAKKNPTSRLHKELYAIVTERWGVQDPRTIERSIRSAIKYAWERREVAVWSYYFPPEKYGDKPPCNRAFITRLAGMI